MPRETIRASALMAAFAAVLMASSCAAPTNSAMDSSDPERAHPITTAPSYADLKLPFATAASGLEPAENARFKNFVERYLAVGNGAISISVPRGPSATATISYFGERLAKMGVPRARILVGTRNVEDGDGRVELGFITYHASTAPCGDWPNVAMTFSNRKMPNFGCSTQHNLAAMVADPRDLVEPRAMGAGDAARRADVIQKYQKGDTTSAQKTADQSAQVSGIQ